MIKSREWIFRVSCQVDPGEIVFLTGSCTELGSWDPQKLILLIPESPQELLQSDRDAETIWRASIHLPMEEVEYRFGVCLGIKHKSEIVYTVKRWETDLHPRVIPANVSNADDAVILSFGYISEFKKVENGWLIQDCALFLRLCRSNVQNDPIVLWKKKHKDKKCFLKMTPIDISKSSSMESYMDHPTEESTELMELRTKGRNFQPVVEVSVLKEGLTEFKYQEQFGVLCNNEDYIVFQCRLTDPQTTGFLLDYYIETVGDIPKYVGCSFVLPSTYKDNFGVASLPITSPKHIPIGQLTVNYMLVHPLEEFKCNMKVSYARYWKESWRGLEVGHRGAGNSYHSKTQNCANIRENTIASLKHASASGADMVEFDVQLSKDLVPLIYHDFHACIALRHKKEPLKTDLMEIPIKDLTLAQLQKLKVYHKMEKGSSRFSDEDFEDHQPFPMLERALESVPYSCGFNIEIKWTMKLIDGTFELQHPFELNRFLDIILKVVLQSSAPRKIIFSCFHPDICTMLRLKQNLYPVLFLTQGGSKQWPPYDDVRTRSIERAVLYASSANILGINIYTQELLKYRHQIQTAFDHNLIVFCWGDDNSDTDTIRLLKELGLHGIIYDKIDVYNTKESKPSSVFLCEDKETCRCFPSSCKKVNKDFQLSPPREGADNASPSGHMTPSPSANMTPSPSANMTPSPSENMTPSPSGDMTPSPSENMTPFGKRPREDTFMEEKRMQKTSFCGILSHDGEC